MIQGTVKFFNNDKKFGFIKQDKGGDDVFVHISALQEAGLTTLPDGTAVEFEIVEERGRKAAKNLKIIK